MHIANLACLVSAALAVGVQASPVPHGYSFQELAWEIETSPGGPKVSLNGTVQQVIAQLSVINPNWMTDFNVADPLEPTLESLKRDIGFPFTSGLCFLRLDEWPVARADNVKVDINFLNVVPGSPTNGPGPGYCNVVACYKKSNVIWCNDGTDSLTLSGYPVIALGAQYLVNSCFDNSGNVQGQIFAQSPQNWNVIVREGPDECA